jgi:hypothetical protein
LTGSIEQWRLRWESSRSAAADTPGDDLSKALYFVLQAEVPNASQLINLLFAVLFDLIIGSITQMGLLVPNAAQGLGSQGRDLDQIFEHKLLKIRETEDNSTAQVQLKIWYDKHLPSKRWKATKRNAAEDSDDELPGAKLRVVLPDSEEEDDAGGGARIPGHGDGHKGD